MKILKKMLIALSCIAVFVPNIVYAATPVQPTQDACPYLFSNVARAVVLAPAYPSGSNGNSSGSWNYESEHYDLTNVDQMKFQLLIDGTWTNYYAVYNFKLEWYDATNTKIPALTVDWPNFINASSNTVDGVDYRQYGMDRFGVHRQISASDYYTALSETEDVWKNKTGVPDAPQPSLIQNVKYLRSNYDLSDCYYKCTYSAFYSACNGWSCNMNVQHYVTKADSSPRFQSSGSFCAINHYFVGM